MTIDEYKARMKELTDDAAVIDELAEDYAEQLGNAARVAELEQELAARDVKISELAATNMRLVDKIKYVEDAEDAEEHPEEDSPEVMTLEELFEED